MVFVCEGDTVVVHSVDRLERNLDDLRNRPDVASGFKFGFKVRHSD